MSDFGEAIMRMPASLCLKSGFLQSRMGWAVQRRERLRVHILSRQREPYGVVEVPLPKKTITGWSKKCSGRRMNAYSSIRHSTPAMKEWVAQGIFLYFMGTDTSLATPG